MRWTKILWAADDTEVFLELERTFFQREGFELLVARTGYQAFAMASMERPNLILMNLEIPEIKGDECCLRIKQHPDIQHIPVILITPNDQVEQGGLCRATGCEAVLSKPLNRNQLIKTASQFLNLESRSEPRVGARLRIHYGTGEQNLLTDYSVNLSCGGVFIETPEVLPVDTPLTLEFLLPGFDAPVHSTGRVAWINHPQKILSPKLPAGMGVQFVNLTMQDMNALREYVKRECLHATW